MSRGEGPPIGDWIEFEMCEKAAVIPSKIRFKNTNEHYAIKAMALTIGTSDGSWHKLADDIRDIEKDSRYRYDYYQTFELKELCVTPQWIWDNDAKYIRMEVLENYGHDRLNCFSGFRLFGWVL